MSKFQFTELQVINKQSNSASPSEISRLQVNDESKQMYEI